ncbi:hypothetical protein, partial [Klebsiella pneumoniae]|uniref:hypothetical protein n=1 Tax=Klebsiella pneumoniae TaxID=573 RepID=UPI0025A634DE
GFFLISLLSGDKMAVNFLPPLFRSHKKTRSRRAFFEIFFRAIAGADHQLSDEAGPGLSFLA